MKIKRYTATSMRAALAQVRAEQGPDAVILSSRRGDDGIEVIAAVDYDEALLAHMAPQRAAQPAAAIAAAPEPVPALAPSPVIATAKAPMPRSAPRAAATVSVRAAPPIAQ